MTFEKKKSNLDSSPLYQRLPTSDPDSSNSSNFGKEVVLHVGSQGGSQMVITHDRLIANRSEAIVTIQKTMEDLQGMFRQLAGLVAEQGEMITRIDQEIQQTEINVNTARDQLLRYLETVSSNKWLLLKLFFVLIFFVVIFIVFFV